jgi:molybdopterin synthase sulfur carrier subunit
MVKIHFSSSMQSVTKGSTEIDIDFEGTLSALIERLSEVLGQEFRNRLLEDGRIRRYVNIYVDGRDIRFAGGIQARVERDSVVDFVPAVSGG